jgi:peptide/nickel transport system permease protein
LTAVFLAQASRGMGEAMNEDFVKLARAKGLSERTVIIRHAARAALNPVITLFGLSIGALIGGSVLVETILGWPGVGALTVTAVRGRDVPLLMGVVLITSAAVWMGNTAAEFLQVVNDKRLRDAETI